MDITDTRKLTSRFENFQLGNHHFGHLEHIAVAFGMLEQYEFFDAADRISRTIKKMATTAGAPEKYNPTITYAFLALVAERLEPRSDINFEEFRARNPDLPRFDILRNWYTGKGFPARSREKFF